MYPQSSFKNPYYTNPRQQSLGGIRPVPIQSRPQAPKTPEPEREEKQAPQVAKNLQETILETLELISSLLDNSHFRPNLRCPSPHSSNLRCPNPKPSSSPCSSNVRCPNPSPSPSACSSNLRCPSPSIRNIPRIINTKELLTQESM